MSVCDLVTIVKECVLCAWPLVSRRVDYVRRLEENLESLRLARDQLESGYKVIKNKVEDEEKLTRKRIPNVANWLDRVNKLLEEDVRTTLVMGEVENQNKCLSGGCPKNFRSSYKLGKRVCKLIVEVDKEKVEGEKHRLDDLTLKEHLTISRQLISETVGLDSMVQKVWDYIQDPALGIIGLYGMGGVGKTTLLKRINNEFLKRSHAHDFKAVIWVTVSAQPDDEKFKETILEALGISPSQWKNTGKATKSSYINRNLGCQKFVLLLDDVSVRVDLLNMGVPLSEDHSKSKVVFTARSEQVCGHMEAQLTLKVECLKPEEALALFQDKVGKATLNIHPSIPKLAEEMASECKGLPLTLITVGCAMKVWKSPEAWETAISKMRSNPSEIPRMSKVVELLESSFDALLDPTLKSCFTYCYIFPEYKKISKEQLIEHWIREGFLGGDEIGVGGTRREKGDYCITSLKHSCLLESGESEEFVRMHDVIYGLDLWGYKKKNRGANSNQAYRSPDWKKVEKMWLWDDNIQDLPLNDLQLSSLQTLVCKVPNLKGFPSGFFDSMPALKVLDLSGSSELSVLPGEIGTLICLEYLNLSKTAVVELPIVLQKLTKMKFLVLDYMENLKEIPRAVISEFQLLEVFSNLVTSNKRCSAECLLEDLERLRSMSEICIAIENATSVQRLLRSQKLQQCIRKISLICCKDLTSLEVSFSSLERLEHLEFFNCIHLSELKISPRRESAQNHSFLHLGNVLIVGGRFKDVTWLTYAPRLKTLTLIDCELMEVVVPGVHQEIQDIFSRLTALHLKELPRLESICPHALPFPSLTKIEVQKCPILEKLPFDSNSAKNSLKLITGERSWWEGLQWDEATKKVFSSTFVEG